MYKKILVPLDGSELAEIAIPYAELVARQLESEIDLLTVTDFDVPDAVRVESEEYLYNLAVHTHTVYSQVMEGNPADVISDYAENNGVDLIIMTTHGRSGISRWALGSIADKVITSTSCPVLLIRSKRRGKRPQTKEAIKKILVTLDGSKESESVLPHAVELCSGLKAEIVLLRVIPHPYHIIGDVFGPVKIPFSSDEAAMLIMDTRDYLGQIRAELEKHQVIAKCQVRIGDEAEEIVKLADELHVDLVAMSTHGRSGIRRWMLGSVSDKVLQCGSTPILMVRAWKNDSQLMDDASTDMQSSQMDTDERKNTTSRMKLVKQ